MADIWDLYEGIGSETKNKPEIICNNFIKKISQMDGNQLALFLKDYSTDISDFSVLLTFRIPFRTDFIDSIVQNVKRDGRNISG